MNPAKSRSKPGSKTNKNRPTKLSPKMNGADILVAALEREGVEAIFAYPGGASMLMHQSLTRSKKIRTILPRHEQGGVFMAEGYARASGKVGVCMATSGPGATNLVTGIADAFMDSVPLVAITGQVNRNMIGKGAFQETDVFGLTLPVVKHNYLVMDVNDIPRIIKEAFHIAITGRPGPVLIDVPKDVQASLTQPIFPEEIHLRGFQTPPRADDTALHEVLGLIEKSERPVLYVGGGVITGECSEELRTFVKSTHIPVATTIMGMGSFPENDPLSLKWLGMHGTVFANYAVDESDLVIALGARFDDRVTGKVSAFASRATIVHIDIDNSEINKNKAVHLPILSDVKYALAKLNRMISREGRPRKDFPAWHAQIAQWKKDFPLRFREPKDVIMPQRVIRDLYELTRGEAIVTTGVGQHQMWAGQYYDFVHPRSFLTSAGLGSMGFGYPAALGAKVACPNRQVIDIDGDGSFLMNVQELATAVAEKIPAKAIIINNQYLGHGRAVGGSFLRQQPRPHLPRRSRRSQKESTPITCPICQGFGVKAERVIHPKDLRPALQRMLDSKEAYVLDIMVPYTEHVLPMIPAGMTAQDIIMEPMDGENGQLTGDIPG